MLSFQKVIFTFITLASIQTWAVCGVPQDLINAAEPSTTLDMTGCSYNGTITISKPLRLVGLTLNSPANASAVVVTASDVTLERVTLRGPQATSYDANAIGISARGTASRPVYRLSILDSVISRYGSIAMNLDYVYDVKVLRNTIEDHVYAGIIVLSAKGGLVQGNTVRRIGVYGASVNYNNAYGIAISQQDPTVDPQSTDVIVDGNVVEDVPTWHGLDTHAGIRIQFKNNIIRRCQDGIFITGDDTYRRALNVITDNNRIEAPAGADQYGITYVYSTGGSITNNNIIGYPSGHNILTTSDGDDQATAQSLTISGNYSNSSAPPPVSQPPVVAPKVSLSASSVIPGATFTVNISGAGTSVENWVALYAASAADADMGYNGNWMFLNGLHTLPASPISSSSLRMTAPMEPGVYNVRLFAQSDTNIRLAISANITVVAGPAVDSTAPVTSITSPANSSYVPVRTNVTIQAQATDNVKVASVEFYVNGSLQCTTAVAPYRCVWRVPRGRGKIYTLQTKARDAAGNLGVSSIVKVISN